jgi:hypothetical protein
MRVAILVLLFVMALALLSDRANAKAKKTKSTKSPTTAGPTKLSTRKPTKSPTIARPTPKPTTSSKKPTPLDDDTIPTAVQDWCAGGKQQTGAVAALGKIQDWDVSRVTTMARLFKDQKTCNPPIGLLEHGRRDRHGAHVQRRLGVQPAHRQLEHGQGGQHVKNVLRLLVQQAHRQMEHGQGDRHGAPMFSSAQLNQPIGNWNTAAVT